MPISAGNFHRRRGTAPTLFAYTINGIAQTPVLSNAGGTYTINAPTNVAGPFVYSITTVTDASSTLCNQSYNNTVTTTITVKPLPTASVTGSATEVCLNAASPQITLRVQTHSTVYDSIIHLMGAATTRGSNAARVYVIPCAYKHSWAADMLLPACRKAAPMPPVQQNITGQQFHRNSKPIATGSHSRCYSSMFKCAISAGNFHRQRRNGTYTFAYTINGIAQTPVVNAAGIYH